MTGRKNLRQFRKELFSRIEQVDQLAAGPVQDDDELWAYYPHVAEAVAERAARLGWADVVQLYVSTPFFGRPSRLRNFLLVCAARCRTAAGHAGRRSARSSKVTSNSESLLTVGEAAGQLAVSVSTVRNLVDAGRIAVQRIGTGRGVLRIRPADLAAFQQSLQPDNGRDLDPRKVSLQTLRELAKPKESRPRRRATSP